MQSIDSQLNQVPIIIHIHRFAVGCQDDMVVGFTGN
jgi:hypothetical protein